MARSLRAAALLVLACAAPASAQKFYPDDPIAADHDDLPVPRPKAVSLSTAYDVLEHTFGHRPGGAAPRARNVNTLGEVPDSSWFENRIGVRSLSAEELARGPNQTDGPDTSAPWTVIAAKSGGITPGFRIRDARGDVYFVKFDPREYPNLSSAAEVVGTRFFHALGYHVPENHVAFFRRAQLRVDPQAKVTRAGGRKEPMTEADLDLILARVALRPDGTMRCAASRLLPGDGLGPHKYHGTRPDDPNDVVPHEDRRELRGMRVFAAWLNHDDSRSLNSEDRYLAVPGGGYVKHFLLDFSSTLGAGSDARRRIAPQNPRAGNEYIIEVGSIVKAAATLGLWDRPWRKVRYAFHPEIGRLEAEFFRPERWKPEYPNPAFERMRPEDAFWAARIVSRFTDEAVRALVATGRFDDPAAERQLADTLLARRDKIVAHYFRTLNPLDGFRVAREGSAASLVFENLGEVAGLGRADSYEVEWLALDNDTGKTTPLVPATVHTKSSVPIPDGSEGFLVARLRTRSATVPAWARRVDVFLRREGMAVVGIEREE